MSGAPSVLTGSQKSSKNVSRNLMVSEWLLRKGLDLRVCRAAGVRYTASEGSVLYPRLSWDNELLGWKVRKIDSGRMYNTPSGIPLVRCQPFVAQTGTRVLVICEGETDALTLASHAVWLRDAMIVGCPGATAFANEWAGYYAKHEEVYLVPDVDEAGEKLVQKVCSLMPRTKVVRLPEGDLNDFIIRYGSDRTRECFDGAAPVQIRTTLRRTGYDFRSDVSIDRSALATFVLKDTQLRRRGKELIGLCPFHDEKTPSFMLDTKKNVFYCHGCGAGGDAISYVRKRNEVGFGEAIRIIKSAGF